MKKYPFFSYEKYTQNEIIVIEVKTWIRGAQDSYDKNEVNGIRGSLKQMIYKTLKEFNINLYIIDLNLKEERINSEKPTFFKLNLMFNPEGYFNDKKFEKFYENFNNYFDSFKTVLFNPNKDKLN